MRFKMRSQSNGKDSYANVSEKEKQGKNMLYSLRLPSCFLNLVLFR